MKVFFPLGGGKIYRQLIFFVFRSSVFIFRTDEIVCDLFSEKELFPTRLRVSK